MALLSYCKKTVTKIIFLTVLILIGHETQMLCFLRMKSLLGIMLGLGSFKIKSMMLSKSTVFDIMKKAVGKDSRALGSNSSSDIN